MEENAKFRYRYLDLNGGKQVRMYDMVRELASESGFTQKAARDFLNSLSRIIRRHMINGDMIQLKGVGKFCSYERSAHQRYNFTEDCVQDVPARMVPKFLFARRFVHYFDEHFGKGEGIIGDEEEYDED